MKKYLFVYLATGPYTQDFEGFVESLKHMCPSVKKDVKFVTDDIDYDISSYNSENISVEKYYTTSLPWPLVTYLKLHYIEHFLSDEYDLIWYCNSNFRFNEIENLDDLGDDDIFHFVRMDKAITRGEEYDIWDETFCAYGDILHPYILGTLFFGGYESMKKACEYFVEKVNYYLINCVIPSKHDEFILNFYLSDMIDKKDDKYDIIDFQDLGYLDHTFHWRNGDVWAQKEKRKGEKYCKPLKVESVNTLRGTF